MTSRYQGEGGWGFCDKYLKQRIVTEGVNKPSLRDVIYEGSFSVNISTQNQQLHETIFIEMQSGVKTSEQKHNSGVIPDGDFEWSKRGWFANAPDF